MFLDMNVGFSKSAIGPTLSKIFALIPSAADLTGPYCARLSTAGPAPLATALITAGPPSNNAVPSAATLNLLAMLAAATSESARFSVSILLVGPPSKKSPMVSTSGVVAKTSAAPKAAISPVFPRFLALAALAAMPPGTTN